MREAQEMEMEAKRLDHKNKTKVRSSRLSVTMFNHFSVPCCTLFCLSNSSKTLRSKFGACKGIILLCSNNFNESPSAKCKSFPFMYFPILSTG